MTELPSIPHTFLPGRADHPLNLTTILEKHPAFKTLCAAAKEEELLREAAEKFSRPQADADHAAESKTLRENVDIEGLKSLGGLEARRRAYEEHSISILEDIAKLRRQNLQSLLEVSRLVIESFLSHAEEARAEVNAVFEKHHLPTPEPESIEAPFWNTARWYAYNAEQSEKGFGMSFDRLVKKLEGR